MAGLYDRVTTNNDNVPCHYVVGAMKAYAAGAWTQATILDGINAIIASPLTQAEQDDLTAIADEVDAQSTATLKLVYVNKIEAAFIAGEAGVLPEVNFRNMLGIA